MTIPSTPRKAGPLLGNGVQTSWPFTFKVFADADILVTVADNLGIESELTLTSDYTVTLNPNQETSPGGTVTYLLPEDYTLVITGDIDYDQPLDLPSGGAFSPTALENELDRLTMQIQQLREAVNRAVQAPITSNASGYLPTPQSNALIGWNESETAMQNFPLSEIATAIAFATYRYDTFTGDGTTTSFVLSADPVTLGNIDVSVDGQTYVPGVDHTLVGQNLVFTVAPADGVEILARYGQGMASGVSGDALDISYQPAGVGAVLTNVEAKLKEFVSAKDFGAVADGVTDDATELNNALASGASVVRLAGSYLIGATVTVPSGVDVLAEPGTTITSNGSGNFVVSGSNTIENVAFAFGSSARRVVGDGVSNVTFRNCSATGSTGNGFDLYNGPSDILFENCKAYSNGGYGIAVLGSVSTAPTRINIRGCRTYSNSYDGICVAGVGQKTSPVQAANYATNVVISGCMSYSNGSGGAFNGITTPYCRYVTIADCLTYSNLEHGIALQETFDFTIANPVSHSNGQAGICMQSGYDPFNPTARGTVVGAHCYANANEGLALKEQVQYVIFTGCNFTGNTQYSVRLRDIGGSGLYSSYITFVGCAFNPSGGAGFTNSNSSRYVTSGAAYNYAGAPLQPNQAVTAALSTATTIDSRGATFDYPEVFVMTNSGTQVSRTAISQATLGRRITLMADASGGVAVRHNQGDGVTYAGFINSAAATVTLGAWKSITYVGNGTDWIEVAKNT